MDVRTRILAVATRRFARQGFDSTSLQVIADEVGVRKPSVLHHFPSKAELQQAVLDNLFEHWNETLPRLLEAVTSGRGRFEAMTEELVRFFLDDPDRARLVVRQLMDRPNDTRERITARLGPWRRLIADYIRKSQEVGQVREDVDPESYIAHLVTLAISSVAAFSVVSGILPSDSTAEQHMTELKRIARAALFERPPAETEP
jgi:AcrR family transcriptional regulator